MKNTLWLVLICALAGCASKNATLNKEGHVPSLLLGNYQDDYGIEYTIEETLWHQHPDARYHIVQWFPEDQYVIAQNDTANAHDGGLWTRIDWLELSGMEPFKWAFCMSAYNASSAEEAGKFALLSEKLRRRVATDIHSLV